MLRRQLAALQMALKNKNPPPPRRTASPSSSPNHRLPTTSNTSNLSVEDVHSSDQDRASLNVMSALSHVNSSSAVLAAKAFTIATGIVAVGGTVFIWGVRETLGVKNAREFGDTMRLQLLTVIPSLSSAIHRPQTEEEQQESQDAEMLLKRAFEDEVEARLEGETGQEDIKSRTRSS